MIDTLDESVGEVFETLGETGRLENTVVFFSSDNGGTPFGSHSSRSFNWPLRGTKLSVWEGSMRVPAFVWSPLLKRKRWVSNAPMHFIDLFTTVYSVAGGDTSRLEDVDGLDMWEHMSRGSESPRTELLYNIDPLDPPELSVAAIRDTRYKLVLDGTGFNSERYETAGGRRPYEDLDKLLVQSKTYRVLRKLYGTRRLGFPRGWRTRATLTCGKGTRENFSANDTVFLFDIVKDPCELNNLASERPDIVSALMKRLDAYRAVTVPIENLPFDPASAPEYHNGTWAPWLD
ncbi:hypothetical protein HPB52_016692 [Rhipicephalus sanguineus]|uniref:Sulfatase N-terminal domain-containing protein n=2 Tax=Rhipicephalus sanguineus TaxID=34632 RepID=A0A9D4PL94_RHISA|nr:hypothetical protein HPB52_016692 [Rhipicephalus sanguineus]